MEEERQSRLLENIFRAISEDLVAQLITVQRKAEIPLYRININTDGNQITLNREQLIDFLPPATTSVSQPFTVNEYQTDPEHRIDVVMNVGNDLYAIEVKAGRTGLVRSPASFLNFCRKNPARLHNGKKIAGLMPSILGHTTDEYTLASAYQVLVERRPIHRTWYLCLRHDQQWVEQTNSNANKDTANGLFLNCRIFYFNQLATSVGKDSFTEILRNIIPTCQCEAFVQAMWKQALAEG